MHFAKEKERKKEGVGIERRTLPEQTQDTTQIVVVIIIWLYSAFLDFVFFFPSFLVAVVRRQCMSHLIRSCLASCTALSVCLCSF